LLDVPAARSPKRLLELTLLQSTLVPRAISPAITPTATPTPAARPKERPAEAPKQIKPEKPVAATETPAPAVAPETDGAPEPIEALASIGTNDVTELWQQTLDEIKKQYNTLYGIARMAKPELIEDSLTLSFKFAFHQKRINEAKNRKILADAISRLAGRSIDIHCIVAEPELSEAPKSDVTAISNIFGGAELLES
jgi:hypothetical protein